MGPTTIASDRAKDEAASWFARLKRREVSNADLEAFRLWRKAPGNREAYDQVEAFWHTSGELQTSPAMQEAIDAALTRASAPSVRRLPPYSLGLAAAFALAVVLAGGSVYILLGPRTYQTEVGEQKPVKLADGSSILLDTDSKVVVRLSKARRRIELQRGQAQFDVAKDAQRPFVVQAGPTTVTALGTRFDVRREDGGAKVTLIEGVVEVAGTTRGPAQVWRLHSGQSVDTQASAPKPANLDVATATSWTNGRLVFRGMRLVDAIAEFDRYEKQRIELDPGPWVEDRVTGVFDVGDTDAFVTSVAQLHDLAVTRSAQGVIRLGRPAPPTP